MAKYSVTKNYGHFRQIYHVEAVSDDDAWMRAERDGERVYQFVYNEPTDIESEGYVINLDEKAEEEPPITLEQYYEWMREAIEKGMKVKPYEYEAATGLPFHDVW